MSMLPIEYLKKATDEQLSNGLLIQLRFREKYSYLSAVGMKFDNGGEIIESPLFGDKRKIDRTLDIQGHITKVKFGYSKNVYSLQLNEEIVIEALK